MAAVDISKYPFYDFPPFYTLQTVSETRRKQIDMWERITLDYCSKSGTQVVDVNTFPLFVNEKIQRTLQPVAIKAVLNHLKSTKNGYWKDENTFVISKKTSDDWSIIIYQYICSNYLLDTILTVESLLNGDRTRDAEFYEMDSNMFCSALQILQTTGKAKLIVENGQVTAVKFI
ncbi:hypothetical protein WA158_000166 [Blastocystis sp. Blastoise]